MPEIDPTLLSHGVPGRRSLHAHRAVYDQAVEITLSLYEELMRVDEVRKQWKAKHPEAKEKVLVRLFVKKYVFQAVPAARAMMAAQLATVKDEALKAALYEALTLDATLMRGRGRPLTGKG